MDPRAVLRPVGPHPARVYWFRRLVLFAIVVVLVLAVARSCTGGSGGTGSGLGTPSATPTPSARTTGRPVAHRAGRCKPVAVQVLAATDATTYPAGVDPQLTVSVRNAGTVPCRADVSPSAQEWTITSGPDRVWTTRDCPATANGVSVRLKPQGSIAYRKTWNRQRSAAGCGTGADAAPGTYVLRVTIAGVTSAPAVFHLT